MRRILEDWQDGLLMWPDADAAPGVSGLPVLYVAAYHAGVSVRRRLADEAKLVTIALRGELTTEIWRANAVWQSFWSRQWMERGRQQGWDASEPL